MEEMQLLNINELKPHPRNSEFFDDITGDSWKEFVESIRTSGVIEPIIITQDKVIVSGHQRIRACKELGIKQVLVKINTDYQDEDMILKDLLETNICQRGIGNPNPVKLGRCIKELERIYGIRHGSAGKVSLDCNNFSLKSDPHNEEEFADRLGISSRSLQNYKKLADLIPEVEDFLCTGMISPTTAIAIARQLSADDQVGLILGLDATKKYTQREIDKRITDIKNKNTQLEQKLNRVENENVSLKNKINAILPDDSPTKSIAASDELVNIYIEAKRFFEDKLLRIETCEAAYQINNIKVVAENYKKLADVLMDFSTRIYKLLDTQNATIIDIE